MENTGVTQSINAAYDSVNLVNKTILKPVDDKNKKIVKLNIGHLQVMMKKNFFVEALTANQKTEIESCIAAGKQYID